MTDQYDVFADQYDASFQMIPVRQHVEAFSVFKLLGSVAGVSALDAACGTGAYTRELRRRGATRVFGVDISPEMIKVARSIEAADPLGIEYDVQDVATLEQMEPFDCALAIYLLHYAPTRQHLVNMCHGIARNISSGSRFITYQLNPDTPATPGYYQEYGLNLRLPEHMEDGSALFFSATIGDITSPEFTIYRWSTSTVEAALLAAGFTGIRWIKPEVSPQGIAQYGDEYWQTYLNAPHCMLVECTKA
jgi:toxoflavin synthase